MLYYIMLYYIILYYIILYYIILYYIHRAVEVRQLPCLISTLDGCALLALYPNCRPLRKKKTFGTRGIGIRVSSRAGLDA